MSDLYPHQEAALRKLTNGKVLWGGTGTGKTKVAATYYQKNEAPRDVYVITTALKRDKFDWQEEFYGLGVGPVTGPATLPSSVGRRSKALARSDVRGDLASPQRGSHNSQSSEGASGLAEASGDVSRKDGRTLEEGRVSERSFEASRYPYVLTVDSWNNIAKYADVAGAFFIFDEQRLVGSGNWVRKFLRIAKHNHWILLSATPGDTWMDYVPLFVANGFYKNRTAFIREHVVYNNFTKFPKIDRYINQGRLVRLRSQILVEMPMERHTRRRHVEVMLEYDKALLERVLKERWHVYEDRPLNDVGEMFLVGRKVVNSDPSRLEMVKELWKNHPRLIVFYNFNYELLTLRSLRESFETATGSKTPMGDASKSSMTTTSTHTSGSSGFADNSETSQAEKSREIDSEWKTTKTTSISASGYPKSSGKRIDAGKNSGTTTTFLARERVSLEESSMSKGGLLNRFGKPLSSMESAPHLAEWNGHKHQPVPSVDQWIYLVQYTAGAEAWDCTTTDAMIMFSQNYSWKTMQQAYGRIDRLNTPFKNLWYYGFTTNSFVDQAIGRSLNAKETFNAAKYSRLFKD
jgi:hypothetical protein